MTQKLKSVVGYTSERLRLAAGTLLRYQHCRRKRFSHCSDAYAHTRVAEAQARGTLTNPCAATCLARLNADFIQTATVLGKGSPAEVSRYARTVAHGNASRCTVASGNSKANRAYASCRIIEIFQYV